MSLSVLLQFVALKETIKKYTWVICWKLDAPWDHNFKWTKLDTRFKITWLLLPEKSKVYMKSKVEDIIGGLEIDLSQRGRRLEEGRGGTNRMKQEWGHVMSRTSSPRGLQTLCATDMCQQGRVTGTSSFCVFNNFALAHKINNYIFRHWGQKQKEWLFAL